MKNVKSVISLLVITLSLLVSCSKDENNPTKMRATSTEFSALKEVAMKSKIQDFQLDANQTQVVTTESGVQFVIDGNCITNNGSPISGTVDIKVIELFKSGGMVIRHS